MKERYTIENGKNGNYILDTKTGDRLYIDDVCDLLNLRELEMQDLKKMISNVVGKCYIN